MTLDELKLIESKLLDYYMLHRQHGGESSVREMVEISKASDLIEREIRLKTLDPRKDKDEG